MQEKQSLKNVLESTAVTAKDETSEVISYRLKCAESGNGLSHYIMYGDLPHEAVNE